jgi:hypothetical protein
MDDIEITDDLFFVNDGKTITVFNTGAFIGMRCTPTASFVHLANNVRFDFTGDMRDKMERACKKRKFKKAQRRRDPSKPRKPIESEKKPKPKSAKIEDID